MKTLYVAVMTLALPVVVAAQTPAQSPPTDPITTAFRNRTISIQKNLAEAFDSIPEAKFGYKPTPAQLTIGYIAQHLAEDNYFFCNNFGEMKATVPAKESQTPDSVRATWSKADLVSEMKDSFKFCESAFAQLNDSNIGALITITGPNGQTRQVPRASYVLGHALDIADHYSQIANYMRLNGMIPPSALPRPGAKGTP